ncbi:MAG: hypothetical protein IJQ21_08815 [Lachnospiraceae bacterium]|nr:hypothetical protein [Lachnospiraceae bacterium]
MLKTGIVYLLVSLFCFVFGRVYEYFGFGVTSPFMHLAFLIPLLLGALPCMTAALTGVIRRNAPRGDHPVTMSFLGAGIATLTVGSLFRGALDIYGTSSPLTVVYPVAGILCLVIASGTAFLRRR